ncbi:MAG: hypothetical protein ACRDD1_21095 [Planctomycetia bacterium]
MAHVQYSEQFIWSSIGVFVLGQALSPASKITRALTAQGYELAWYHQIGIILGCIAATIVFLICLVYVLIGVTYLYRRIWPE